MISFCSLYLQCYLLTHPTPSYPPVLSKGKEKRIGVNYLPWTFSWIFRISVPFNILVMSRHQSQPLVVLIRHSHCRQGQLLTWILFDIMNLEDLYKRGVRLSYSKMVWAPHDFLNPAIHSNLKKKIKKPNKAGFLGVLRDFRDTL